MLLSGLKYPMTSSVLGVAWCVNRVIYAVGYTRADQQDGKGRLKGIGYAFCQLGLFLLTGWTGFSVLNGW